MLLHNADAVGYRLIERRCFLTQKVQIIEVNILQVSEKNFFTMTTVSATTINVYLETLR